MKRFLPSFLAIVYSVLFLQAPFAAPQGRFSDLLVEDSPWTDVRKFMDGQSGRNSLAAWIANDNIVVAAALQAALNSGKKLVFPDGNFNLGTTGLTYTTSGRVYLNISGSAMGRTTISYSGTGSALKIFGSAFESSGDYADMVADLQLSHLRFFQSNANRTGTGLELRSCAEVVLNDIRADYFDRGVLIQDVPGLSAYDLKLFKNNYNLSINQTSIQRDSDVSVMHFYNPIITSPAITSLRVNGGRQIMFHGGSIMPGPGGPTIAVRAENRMVESLSFIGTTIEKNYAGKPALSLGTAGDKLFAIRSVSIIGGHLYSTPDDGEGAIELTNVGKLKVEGTEFTPTTSNAIVILAGSTQLELDGYIAYKVQDRRDLVNKTIIPGLFRGLTSLVLNPQMDLGTIGYAATTPPIIDNTSFVTGSHSLFNNTVAPSYKFSWFSNDGGKFTGIPGNDTLVVDAIIKCVGTVGGFDYTRLAVYFLTRTIGGGGDAVQTVTTATETNILQNFRNGFRRVLVKYQIPIGKELYGVFVQNNSNNIWLDYFQVYADNWHPSNPYILTNQVLPTAIASMRGAIVHFVGGAGVSDKTVIAIKNAGNTYEWKALW